VTGESILGVIDCWHGYLVTEQSAHESGQKNHRIILEGSTSFFSSGKVLQRAMKSIVTTKVHGDQLDSSISQIVPIRMEAFQRTVRSKEIMFTR